MASANVALQRAGGATAPAEGAARKAFNKIFKLLLILGARVTTARDFYFFIVCLEGVLPARSTPWAEECCKLLETLRKPVLIRKG